MDGPSAPKTNQNPATLPDVKNSSPHPEQVSATPLESHDLFFNVMPKVSSTDELVKPKMTIKDTQSNAPVTETPGFFSLYKWWLISIFFLLIAAIAGYYVYNTYFAIKPINYLADPSKIKDLIEKANQASSTKISYEEWQNQFFKNEICQEQNICGDQADPDNDGLPNLEEYKSQTDPNNQDSDQDGLADGDEIKVFLTNPLSTNSGKDARYSDKDYLLGAYSFNTDQKMTEAEILETTRKMKENGLHQPTISSLHDSLITLYKFTDWDINTPSLASSTNSSLASSTEANASSYPVSTLDMSDDAKTDRDAQRSGTIQKIMLALLKYKADNNGYPTTSVFKEMFDKVKPYIQTATNPNDPINKEPYVYKYSSDGKDFTISFYSELADKIIKKHEAEAIKARNTDLAAKNDDTRMNDLKMLRTALLLYSAENADVNQDYIFPTAEKYKIELVPQFIAEIPKDPVSQEDYEYEVSDIFDSFTIKAVLDEPSKGKTGYLCNQIECREY